MSTPRPKQSSSDLSDRRAPLASETPTVNVMTPTGHHVIVQVEDIPEETAAGIIVPENARQLQEDSTMYGKIVAIGFQAWSGFGDGKPWAHVGDTVVFRKHSGAIFRAPEGVVRVINDDDVLVVIQHDVPLDQVEDAVEMQSETIELIPQEAAHELIQ